MIRILIILALLLPTVAWGTPSVTGGGGSLTHDGTGTITGSGFGSKTTPAPVMWDNAEGRTTGSQAALLSYGWAQAVPNNLSGVCAGYKTSYRTAGETISNPTHTMSTAPHSKSTGIIAGGHAPNVLCNGSCISPAEEGANVAVAIAMDTSGYVYVSWYEKVDDNWPVDVGLQDNYKWFQIGQPSINNPHFYLNNVGGHSPWHTVEYQSYRDYGLEDNCNWEMNVSTLNQSGDPSGEEKYTSPNVKGNWIRREVFAKNGREADGWLFASVNGKIVMEPLVKNLWNSPFQTADPCAWAEASGEDVPMTGLIVGGYYREEVCSGSIAAGNENAWRFFDDIYIDNTWQRVVLCNTQTLAGDGTDVCEPQIPTLWADGSITFTVNQGAIPDGTAYLFVFDSANDANATGYEVTLGEGGETPTPSTVSGVMVKSGPLK